MANLVDNISDCNILFTFLVGAGFGVVVSLRNIAEALVVNSQAGMELCV